MKKVMSLLLTITLLTGSLFVLTGCEKNGNGGKEKKDNTVKISYELGKGKITVAVPKDEEGNPKYEFTTEKPAGLSVTKTFYLVTDKTMIGFATSGMSYNTSAKYKAKYGDTKASFDGYLEFIEDKDLFDKSYLPGLEQFEINGRKALRYYNRSGSSSAYKYYGYFYMIGADDIYPGSKLDVVVNYKDEEKPAEAKEFDQETLDIINSIKVEANA
jgi:hypothetical protein